jgi:hypothetical protein
MAMLTENPIAIVVVGALAAVFAAVVFLARRTSASLMALAGIIAVTVLLLVVERVVVTDREAVEAGLEEVLAALEANDVRRVLASIDPTSAVNVKADVEALMPRVKVTTANAAAVAVEVNGAASPPTATCEFRAYLNGTHGSSGTPLLYMNQKVLIGWTKRGDRWLIDNYQAFYDDQPINAVDSARGNRPVPGR